MPDWLIAVFLIVCGIPVLSWWGNLLFPLDGLDFSFDEWDWDDD